MTRLIAIAFVALFVAGCTTTRTPDLIGKEQVVFVPDSRFFKCPTVAQFPDPKTLTDSQIAELLIKLDTYNRTCKKSLDAVRAQLVSAKKRLETR